MRTTEEMDAAITRLERSARSEEDQLVDLRCGHVFLAHALMQLIGERLGMTEDDISDFLHRRAAELRAAARSDRAVRVQPLQTVLADLLEGAASGVLPEGAASVSR